MSDKVDAMFSSEIHTRTPLEARNRLVRLNRTLRIAIVLDVLGVPCWTSVPGAALTLWVWLATDSDLNRIEAGEYSDADAAFLMKIRRYATAALVFCVASLVLQIFLLSSSFYERFWGSMSVAFRHIWQSI